MKLVDKVIAVDVAIIGGLAGLSTTYFLNWLGKEGVDVIVSKC